MGGVPPTVPPTHARTWPNHSKNMNIAVKLAFHELQHNYFIKNQFNDYHRDLNTPTCILASNSFMTLAQLFLNYYLLLNLLHECLQSFANAVWRKLKKKLLTYTKVHGSVSVDAMQRKEAEESACGKVHGPPFKITEIYFQEKLLCNFLVKNGNYRSFRLDFGKSMQNFVEMFLE